MSSNKGSGKHTDYVTRGLKATIHNPNTSEEAKESAAERLRQMGVEVPSDYSASSKNIGRTTDVAPDEDNQIGEDIVSGETETVSTDLRSGGTRRRDVQVDDVYPEDTIDDEVDDSHSRGLARGATNNAMGGYKATLKNPKVSAEAKEHAQNILNEAYAEDDE